MCKILQPGLKLSSGTLSYCWDLLGFGGFLAQASESVISHLLGLSCADTEPLTAEGPLGEISSDRKSSRQSTEFLLKNTKQERNRFISSR